MPPIDTEALDRALARIRPETIDAHLRFLAHPLLEGRAPGTRGGTLAMEYIRSQFQRIGLEPAAGGSYLQEVPMVGLTPHPTLAFHTPQGAMEPAYEDEYVLEAGVPETAVETDAPLVFAGFGITAPEWSWDDFKDVDVRGKVLLLRVNDPGTEATPDFFGGRTLTYYGRWTYKFEEASRRGAAGAILIHTDASAGYPWRVVRTSNTGQQFDLAGTPEFPLQIKGWIGESVARDLLARAGHDLAALVAQSDTPGFRPLDTGIRVRASVRSEVQSVRTANVVGLLPGAEPGHADEPVILSSHYDHLGVRQAADGTESIHAGAYDNASGVALLLTIAEAIAGMETRPARPLLFVSTTAEESGLLGAEWYARNPLFPLRSTAAALNVDGANLQGRTRDLTPLGADRSTLGDTVRAAAEAEGMTINPDPHPEQGMFYRQDHFPLARSGVPALALDHGLTFEGRPEGWGQQWYDAFVSTHYHQPSDSYAEGWDYRGAVQQGRVMLRTALAAASAPEIAAWTPGAGFARR
ncbi:MAG TPA: M28 family peptidase [Longimicrobium sp.]|nr:M28 family peptidase [Longimicrobium sp.]